MALAARTCGTEVGPCEEHRCIHFRCPDCGAGHDRGYVDGFSLFRCLGCGYSGHGLHPNPKIDAEVGQAIREAQEWNIAHGLQPGPFVP